MARRRGGDVVPLPEHLEAIRALEHKLGEERDRRYAEVNIEKEKALKIKETADETARILVAQNQAYRDEKANELREQINSERGLYATKDDLEALSAKFDLAFEPVIKFMAGYQGGNLNRSERRLDTSQMIAAIAVLALIASVVLPYLLRS